jgi:hypothetical protein
VLAGGVAPPDSFTGEAIAGAGDRRIELHHRLTAPNADAIDAVVAPERHLGRHDQTTVRCIRRRDGVAEEGRCSMT